ncbi:FCD domain-containing protein [Isoptericola sp. NEAU-Y5]|uniref:FCD domain-containing protein n=1 Tax=Isoptericola luteus TaxID=2879484 RepID=A0ABS7ZBL0_9MICO|nr:FCD domain-containing protein [Isoptericola sp. NEAU-Y5]MCA5892288.1 FCD domain-containing protein [Isoptericola sp. NEAU-Y5]
MRTHERVLAHLEEGIAVGRWGLGERLPGERAIAEDLGVSRPSVREAMRILEAMGIVRPGVGSGPGAGAVVVDRPAAGLGAAVRLHVASGTLPVSDVVATRAALETWAMRVAAERVGAVAPQPGGEPRAGVPAGRLAEARRLLDAMSEPGLPVADFVGLDQDFHLELVRIAGNQLTEAILGGLRSAISSYVSDGVRRLSSWPTTADRLCVEHAAILDAVARGDADAAGQAVHQHIWGFSTETGLAGDGGPGPAVGAPAGAGGD